jgi:integrase
MTISLRIRDGKFGKSAILPMPPRCAQTLEQYLQVKPRIEIDGHYPLFYTDSLNKWTLRGIEMMFNWGKRKAGVKKNGGVHVFGRHSPASIMVQNGCDVYSLQQLMRHYSIKTTARYIHADIAVLGEKQKKYLDAIGCGGLAWLLVSLVAESLPQRHWAGGLPSLGFLSFMATQHPLPFSCVLGSRCNTKQR